MFTASLGALVATPLLVLGCDPFGDHGEISHPIPDSLTTRPNEATVFLSRSAAPASVASARKIRDFRARFDRRETLAMIGAADGPEETTFGLVWDAAVTEVGDVLILDRVQAAIRVFSARGQYLYTLGGQGDGPGELDVPEAVLIAPAGHLIVVDQSQLIHRFARREGRFEYRDRNRFDAWSYDACLAGEEFGSSCDASRETVGGSVSGGGGPPIGSGVRDSLPILA